MEASIGERRGSNQWRERCSRWIEQPHQFSCSPPSSNNFLYEQRPDEKCAKRGKKEKVYRIYLNEPFDYFGFKQKIRERQRLLSQSRTNSGSLNKNTSGDGVNTKEAEMESSTSSSCPDGENCLEISYDDSIIGTEPSRPWTEEDLRILRRSIPVSHNNFYYGKSTNNRSTTTSSSGSNTPSNYIEFNSGKPPHSKTAVSIPLKEVLITHLKSCLHRFSRWKSQTVAKSTTTNEMVESSLSKQLPSSAPSSPPPPTTASMDSIDVSMPPNSPMESIRSSRQSRRTTSESSTTFSIYSCDYYDDSRCSSLCCNASNNSTNGSRRQVHFAPETNFSQSESKSKYFWKNLMDKKKNTKSHDDNCYNNNNHHSSCNDLDNDRPRPFLPYLESGLSYRNEEEYYRLKHLLSEQCDPDQLIVDGKLLQQQISNSHNNIWSVAKSKLTSFRHRTDSNQSNSSTMSNYFNRRMEKRQECIKQKEEGEEKEVGEDQNGDEDRDQQQQPNECLPKVEIQVYNKHL